MNNRPDDHSLWDPYEVARQLFESRGFKKYQLLKTDLRALTSLPSADFVVVDAAHDFHNSYADLKLALTANPTFVFVDDCDDENGAKPAIDQFLLQDVNNLLACTVRIPHLGGGLVIRLSQEEGLAPAM